MCYGLPTMKYASTEKIVTPGKLRHHPFPVTKLDNIYNNSIRNHIYSMYENKSAITSDMVI